MPLPTDGFLRICFFFNILSIDRNLAQSKDAEKSLCEAMQLESS